MKNGMIQLISSLGSKLISNVSSMAPDYIFQIRCNTFFPTPSKSMQATQNLKNTIDENYFYQQTGHQLQGLKTMSCHKNPIRSTQPQTQPEQCGKGSITFGQLPKVQILTMSPITAAIRDLLNGLLGDIKVKHLLYYLRLMDSP